MNSSHGLSEQELADLVDHVKTVCALYHLRIECDGVYRALEWMDPLYKAMLERAIVRSNSTISQFIGPTFRNIFGVDLLGTVSPEPSRVVWKDGGDIKGDSDRLAKLIQEGKPIEYLLMPEETQLSFVARSNLYMMTIAGERDARQKPCKRVEIPDDATLKLRAQLILEEAVETCNALGLKVNVTQLDCDDPYIELEADGRDIDVEETIDGCCDTIYVCVGTLLSLGIPDLPHLKHVCERNDAKSPGGVSQTDSTGKVVKPEGWTPPNHEQLIEQSPSINLREIGQRIVERVKNGGRV